MSEDIDHIAQLQSKLYTRDPDAAPKRTVGILRPLKSDVESSWGEDSLGKEKVVHHKSVSGFKRFFIVSFIFFLVALGVALFSIYRGAITLSSKNVEMTILGNSFVAGGEALPIQVDTVNKNAADLVDAQLTLSYPKGSIDATGADLERSVTPIGTIASGKTKSQAFSVVLYGEQGTSRTISASLQYKLAGSNATFVKETTFSVMINSSPVSLTVDAPSSVASNQPFAITIRTVFSGDALLDNALVHVEYPNGFVFSSATPEPVGGNAVWALGDLVKGTERTITIRGKLVGEEQDEKSFHFYVGSRTSETDSTIAVAYNSALRSVTIEQPFISGAIAIGTQTGDVVALPNGSSVSGVVSWKNNAATKITNPELTLSISGDTVNADSIRASGGSYDPFQKTITWNNQTTTTLGALDPGATGELPFSFDTTNPKPGTAGDINLSLSVSGDVAQQDPSGSSISNIDQKTIRFTSRLQFASEALYSIGAIKNTGPFPPKVNNDTTYTVLWTMRPVENQLNNAVATAVLPIGVSWTGVIAPQSEVVSFNPETRVVSWSIGGVPRATSTPFSRSVSFQIKVRPTKDQTDSVLDLLGQTQVSAIDSIASTPLSLTKLPLTSRLSTDPAYSVGKEKVLP